MSPSLQRNLILVAVAVALLWTFPYLAPLNNPNENVRLYMTMSLVDDGSFAIAERELRKNGKTRDPRLRLRPPRLRQRQGHRLRRPRGHASQLRRETLRGQSPGDLLLRGPDLRRDTGPAGRRRPAARQALPALLAAALRRHPADDRLPRLLLTTPGAPHRRPLRAARDPAGARCGQPPVQLRDDLRRPHTLGRVPRRRVARARRDQPAAASRWARPPSPGSSPPPPC